MNQVPFRVKTDLRLDSLSIITLITKLRVVHVGSPWGLVHGLGVSVLSFTVDNETAILKNST